MRRISTSTKVVDKFGTGKHGFTNGNAVGGVPATDLEDVFFDHVQEELCSPIEAAGLTLDSSDRAQLLAAIQILSAPVVGLARNVKMSVTAASASATLTADQVVVATALGGRHYRLASLNKTINLATTGAGGMDTGTATANAWLGIYAIYNPTTGASALLGKLESGAALPSVYGGANLPSGYTASALVAVAPISATVGQFSAFQVNDRKVDILQNSAISSSTNSTSLVNTALTLSGLPYSARKVSGSVSISNSAAGNSLVILYADANGCGVKQMSVNTSAAGGNLFPFADMSLALPRTLQYAATTSSAGYNNAYIIYIGTFEF